jgi:hypothetical protein
MFRPFSAIFGEVLDFLLEYIPADGPERSKHAAGLPHVCILLLDELLAAFGVPLAAPIAQSTHGMTKHHYSVTNRTVTVAANETSWQSHSPHISCFSYNSRVHCRHLTAIPTLEWSAVVCKQSTLCIPADPFCCCHREIARR